MNDKIPTCETDFKAEENFIKCLQAPNPYTCGIRPVYNVLADPCVHEHVINNAAHNSYYDQLLNNPDRISAAQNIMALGADSHAGFTIACTIL